MKVHVYGFRNVDMQDQDTGRRISGVSLYIGYPNDGVEGMQTAKVFINSAMLTNYKFTPRVGVDVNIEYGPTGRPVGISNAG